MIATPLACRVALTALVLGPGLSFGAQELGSPPRTPREQLVARFNHMPEEALAADFLSCDRRAMSHVLSLDDGARCAMAWDALLRRVFGGDVDALIAWWKVHRDESALE